MTSSRSIAFGVGLFAALTFGAAANGSSKDDAPRWKLTTGETLRYEFRQKNVVKVKAAGQNSDNTTDLTIDMTWNVRDVDRDGTADIRLVINRVRSEIKMGDEAIKFDSKEKPGVDPGAQALSAVYGPALGEDYTLKLDARGRLVEATVPEKVTSALRGSPFLATADGGSVLSGVGLKNLFAQLFPVLPGSPADKGAAWSTELVLPVLPMQLTLKFSDKLASINDGIALINAQIVTGIQPDPAVPVTVELKSQTGDRVVSFDTKTGRVALSTIRQSLELNLGYMNRTMEQEISLEESLRLVP